MRCRALSVVSSWAKRTIWVAAAAAAEQQSRGRSHHQVFEKGRAQLHILPPGDPRSSSTARGRGRE